MCGGIAGSAIEIVEMFGASNFKADVLHFLDRFEDFGEGGVCFVFVGKAEAPLVDAKGFVLAVGPYAYAAVADHLER